MNLDELKARQAKGEVIDFLFFFGHKPHASGRLTKSCFSQWWQEPFVVDGVEYLTAEHWMMASKARVFNDPQSLERIIACSTPAESKARGRRVCNYDEKTWSEARYNIVVTGNLHKFGQNPKLAEFLLATGDKILVEASPYDPIWGIGIAETHVNASKPRLWPGKNLLGFALMDVRKELQVR